MPDTSLPPGNPAVSRYANRRLGEQGDRVHFRPSAEPEPLQTAGGVHSDGIFRRAPHEPLWRDIRWVDFTLTLGVDADELDILPSRPTLPVAETPPAQTPVTDTLAPPS